MPSSTGSPDPAPLSIVVPCFNEENSLVPLHEALREAVPGVPVEFVFVDDGSTDGTLEVLRKLAAEDPSVRYTSFSRNFGKEAAMLAGLRRATGDAVVILDADLQHPPRLLPRMLQLHRQGFDQVVATRDRRGEAFLRRTTARLFYRTVNRWIDVRLDDGAGDFRLLSRRAVDAILALPEYNRFAKGLFSWIGFSTVVLPYPNERRRTGRSSWTAGRLINYAFDGLLSFNDKPLRLALYGGLLATVFALGYALWVVAHAVVSGVDVPGYTTIIVAVIGMGGFQAVLLGMIGEYVGRIYRESKRRPHFLIGETDEDAARVPAQRRG
ncbi:glycosyl transferase [Actinoplanes sp. NBRC 14428]|uniref:Glycosyltransferase involved in cell wall biosynthesis n=1 Tax=Pseudosporangium ferrugineum TaxID=439699 RepID=A0A2T0SFD4_9ACTN|nr:glycosyltransferase family 2 protein [Pseudosporangium ferrugineum]PRY32127.1 glycosyltransferase involved in cell wall biosynthesis [Pseudosporangium ferrugineum]BCJ49630.1 glycosyl transferase [Actinoplanes sp. NBRC 14428]